MNLEKLLKDELIEFREKAKEVAPVVFCWSGFPVWVRSDKKYITLIRKANAARSALIKERGGK